MPDITVVHAIEQYGTGGAARALIANARAWQRLGKGRNRIVSLLPASKAAVEAAESDGISVIQTPSRSGLARAIAEADILQVHFFNAPALYRFLASRLPDTRALLWCHVGGDTPGQMLTTDIAIWPDRIAVTGRKTLSVPAIRTLRLPRTESPRLIIGGADLRRVGPIEPRPHSGFNVSYIGTLDPVKLHPEFISMSAAIDVPGVRIVVGGASDEPLRREAAARGVGSRFEFRGQVEDIRSILELTDVFGYPLCADNYSTSDQTVQEAMYAGVPPVVLRHGGVADMIVHNETGLIVDSAADYAASIKHLAEHPEERARLGRNARAYAEAHFGANRCAPAFDQLYDELMSRPKRGRPPLGHRTDDDGETTMTGAELFLMSLGGAEPAFAISATDQDRDSVRAADQVVAASPPAVRAAVLQYSRYFADDPMLALWAGLAHRAAGHHTRALISFRKALARGGSDWRLKQYATEAALALGASPLAAAGAHKVEGR